MIKQDAVAGVEAIAFAVIYRCPVGKNLRDAIRAARPERCLFRLRHLLRLAIHLAARGLVKMGANSGFADRFQNADRSYAGNVGGVFGNIETDTDVALRAEMIDFIRFQIVEQFHQINRVRQIAVMEEQPDPVDVRVNIKMIDARGVECAGAADNSVHLVAFFDQQIGQITAVLAGNAGDEARFIRSADYAD